MTAALARSRSESCDSNSTVHSNGSSSSERPASCSAMASEQNHGELNCGMYEFATNCEILLHAAIYVDVYNIV